MTTQTVVRDPETGLALLPEGYIWRVAASGRYLTVYLVQICTETVTQGKWWWKYEYNTTTEETLVEDYYDTHHLATPVRTKENIAHGLAKLSDTMYRTWEMKQKQRNLMDSFSGDYPPKSLNTVS